MEFTLVAEKKTEGTVRFKEEEAENRRRISIYLEHALVKELGYPQSIKLTIEKAD